MALGNQCRSGLKSKRDEKDLDLGYVRYSRSFRRKRIAISFDGDDESAACTTPKTPLTQGSGESGSVEIEPSPIEALHEEILVTIICGVNHGDLNQVNLVSKAFKAATEKAKKQHFAYSTPSKVPALRTFGEFDEIEAPNAPKQDRKCRPRLTGKNLSTIAANLFGDVE
ncbi:hypothetical protein UlMin_011752 [Ulmus minor]